LRKVEGTQRGSPPQELKRSDAMMFALVLALIGFAVLPALDHCATH
jgi:hypothetical protein